MKIFVFAALFLAITSAAQAKIYKWVDENGTTHFTDKVYTEKAKEVNIQGTGINVQKPEGESSQEQVQDSQEKSTGKAIETDRLAPKVKAKHEEKVITEADYRITSGVGKLGADAISISGRINSGPACENMVVTATARNDNGLSATITQQVRKINSYGSTTFSGSAKVSGSGDDYGFWKVDTVTIRCNDFH